MDESQREFETQLHTRLLQGDITATAEIAEHLLFNLIGRLHRRYPHLDDAHLVDTAVHEAMMQYFQHPEWYDPRRAALSSYLLMSADGDLRNMLKGERGNAVFTATSLDDSEQEGTISLVDGFDLEHEVASTFSTTWSHLQNHLPNPVDQEIVQLMLDNVRETETYADTLGIQNSPHREQQRIVKRHKDRLRKKLRRVLDPAVFRNNDTR